MDQLTHETINALLRHAHETLCNEARHHNMSADEVMLAIHIIERRGVLREYASRLDADREQLSMGLHSADCVTRNGDLLGLSRCDCGHDA